MKNQTFSFFSIFICLLSAEIYSNDAPFQAWNTYPTYTAYLAMMNQFSADYPGLCRVVEYGQSVQGRKLLAAVISDSVAKPEAEPKVFYMSTIHGDEVTGYVLMLRLIDYLLKNYGTDTAVTKLVNGIEIWIAPLLNPDGTYKAGDTTLSGAIRVNANGAELNRNFTSPALTVQPPLEQETKALLELFLKNTFTLSASFHSGAEMIQYPWGCWIKETADVLWWKYVAKQYVDLIQAVNPSLTFTIQKLSGNGIYIPLGGLEDCVLYYYHSRCLNGELSYTKLLQATLLPTYWNYHYKSFLKYMENSLYGINGTVTDSITGQPLRASIFIENHDIDSSHVYSGPVFGDFYRPVYKGTYSVIVSCAGYLSRTIGGVAVLDDAATTLHIKLVPENTGTGAKQDNQISPADRFFAVPVNNKVVFTLQPAGSATRAVLHVYTVRGEMVYAYEKEILQIFGHNKKAVIAQWNPNTPSVAVVSQGIYLARVTVYYQSGAPALYSTKFCMK